MATKTATAPAELETSTSAVAISQAMWPEPNTEAAQKRLILIISSKGGVGKSVIASIMTDIYRSNGIKVRILDTDGRVGSLAASYGQRDAKGTLLDDQNPDYGIGQFDIRDDEGRNNLLDVLDGAPNLVLYDMAGGSFNELKKIVDQGEGVQYLADTIASLGYRITLVHAMSNVRGATLSVKEYAEAFGDAADHVVVINKAWGTTEEDFPFWFGKKVAGEGKKGGKTRADLGITDNGPTKNAVEVWFPALQPGTFAQVLDLNMPYSKAKDSMELTITERAHVARFVRAATDALMGAKEYLGL